MNIEDRLARLELRGSRWRLAGITAFTLLGVAIALLAARQRDLDRELERPRDVPALLRAVHLGAGTVQAGVIRADRLEIGAAGGAQFQVNAYKDYPLKVELREAGGLPRLEFALDADGIPQISMPGHPGEDAVTLTTSPGGDGFLMLRDRKGRVRIVAPKD